MKPNVCVCVCVWYYSTLVQLLFIMIKKHIVNFVQWVAMSLPEHVIVDIHHQGNVCSTYNFIRITNAVILGPHYLLLHCAVYTHEQQKTVLHFAAVWVMRYLSYGSDRHTRNWFEDVRLRFDT